MRIPKTKPDPTDEIKRKVWYKARVRDAKPLHYKLEVGEEVVYRRKTTPHNSKGSYCIMSLDGERATWLKAPSPALLAALSFIRVNATILAKAENQARCDELYSAFVKRSLKGLSPVETCVTIRKEDTIDA